MWVWACLTACATFSAGRGGSVGGGTEASSSPFSGEPPPADVSTLGPGDVLDVRVFREPELSGSYQVTADGTILMPLVGEVKVAELTPAAAAQAIAARYLQGYLAAPEVMVFVQEYNSKLIYVMGEVQKPGSFAYKDNLTILQAIILAGGFTELAARTRVLITRTTQGGEQKLEVSVREIAQGDSENVVLKPGDLVFVPEAIF